MKIQIEISARHAHLTQHDLEHLFGAGFKLTKDKDLSQPGQFSAKETITLVGPKHQLEHVRLMGPCRSHTQIEVSRSDCYFLGATAPVRLSGKIIGSGAIKIVGPKGELELKEGLIVAKRHIHLNKDQAHSLVIKNGDNVRVAIDGPRAVTFGEVEARVDENFELYMHVDTDEANAAGIDGIGEGEIIAK